MDEEAPDLMLAPTPDTLYEAMQAALVEVSLKFFGQQAPRHDPEYEKHKRRMWGQFCYGNGGKLGILWQLVK